MRLYGIIGTKNHRYSNGEFERTQDTIEVYSRRTDEPTFVKSYEIVKQIKKQNQNKKRQKVVEEEKQRLFFAKAVRHQREY
jgi:hypothetical protein